MRNYTVTAGTALVSLLGLQVHANAQFLGAANGFAVLSNLRVGNTGSTVIDGDLGLDVGAMPRGIILTGSELIGYRSTLAARLAEATAYGNLGAETYTDELSARNLSGITLDKGVYLITSSADFSGTITLNAQGDADARFDFQIADNLTTAANTKIDVINGGSASNVYWQVGGSAALGSDTAFKGNLLAMDGIMLGSGSSLAGGSLMSRTGSVDLNSNTVDFAPTPSPEARSTIMMFGAFGLGMFKAYRRRTQSAP